MAGQVIESEVEKLFYEVGHSMSLGQGRGWSDSFAPTLRLTVFHLP